MTETETLLRDHKMDSTTFTTTSTSLKINLLSTSELKRQSVYKVINRHYYGRVFSLKRGPS